MSMQYTTCHEDTPCRGARDMMKAQIHEGDTDRVSIPCWGLCTYWSGATVPYYSIDSSSSSSFGEKLIFRGPRSSSSSLRARISIVHHLSASFHVSPFAWPNGHGGTDRDKGKRPQQAVVATHSSSAMPRLDLAPFAVPCCSIIFCARYIGSYSFSWIWNYFDQPGPVSSPSGRITNTPIPDTLTNNAGQGIGEE